MQPGTLLADRYLVTRLHGHGDGAAFFGIQDTTRAQDLFGVLQSRTFVAPAVLPGTLEPVHTVRLETSDLLLYRGVTSPLVARPAPWPDSLYAAVLMLLEDASSAVRDGFCLAHSAVRHVARHDGRWVLLSPPTAHILIPEQADLWSWELDQHTGEKTWAAWSDKGSVRAINEDAWAVRQTAEGVLAICVDGMGGMVGGDVGPRLAMRAALDAVSHQDAVAVLEQMHEYIRQLSASEPVFRGTGCTAVAAVRSVDRATVAWAGDSRAWLHRGSTLTLLTRDDSLVNKMVDAGAITPEEAIHHPHRPIVLQALGATQAVDIHRLDLEIQPGDRLILTTDGAHGAEGLDADQVGRPATLGDCVRSLVRDAGDPNDNAAAVVI